MKAKQGRMIHGANRNHELVETHRRVHRHDHSPVLSLCFRGLQRFRSIIPQERIEILNAHGIGCWVTAGLLDYIAIFNWCHNWDRGFLTGFSWLLIVISYVLMIMMLQLSATKRPQSQQLLDCFSINLLWNSPTESKCMSNLNLTGSKWFDVLDYQCFLCLSQN